MAEVPAYDETSKAQAIFEDGKFFNVAPFKRPGKTAILKFLIVKPDHGNIPKAKEELQRTLPVLQPDQRLLRNPTPNAMQVTWLGHACVLVQFEGSNILTDPCFSARCGPMLVTGYKRYRPAPLDVSELPEITAVLISHNHYDHLDAKTVTQLKTRFGKFLKWYVPQGVKSWMVKTGVPLVSVTEMNWWDEAQVNERVKVVFTPAHHWSRRGVSDECKTLWGSWCVVGQHKRFYFAGDTGYSHTFKQIGYHYGPFDLAAIPIGAYEPREYMKDQHVNPEEAVKIHCDVRAKRSVGVSWSTYGLSHEPYLDPPIKVKEAMGKFRLDPEAFGLRVDSRLYPEDFFTLNHGETKVIRDSGDNLTGNDTVSGKDMGRADLEDAHEVPGNPCDKTQADSPVYDTNKDPSRPDDRTSVVSTVDDVNRDPMKADDVAQVSSSPNDTTQTENTVVDTHRNQSCSDGKIRPFGSISDKPTVASSSDDASSLIGRLDDKAKGARNLDVKPETAHTFHGKAKLCRNWGNVLDWDYSGVTSEGSSSAERDTLVASFVDDTSTLRREETEVAVVDTKRLGDKIKGESYYCKDNSKVFGRLDD